MSTPQRRVTERGIALRHIAIEGPIGVGKTSLVERLTKRFASTKILEDVDNPFLEDFYKDKEGAAFQVQLFFLLSRYQQQRALAQGDLFEQTVIADYTFPKDKIFAYLNLDDSELLLYDKLYNVLAETVPLPNLVIYLQGNLETLVKRIKKRGRDYERSISRDYLRELMEAYSYYFYHYQESPLLVVNTNEIDFVHQEQHFEDLVEQIEKAQKGVQHYIPLGSR